MSISRENDSTVRRYLLGELPEDEAVDFEEQYFADDDRFAEMLAAEDELLDAFLRSELSALDRQRFGTRFLATERGRQWLALATALEKGSRVEVPLSRPWTRSLAMAAALIIFAAGSIMLRELALMRQQVRALEQERTSLQTQVTARTFELRGLQSRSVFSIVLAGQERSGGTGATIVLPRESDTAELWLVLPQDDYPSYTATLQSVDGHILSATRGLTSRAIDGRRAVVLRMLSASLQPETFVIALSGDKPGSPSEPVEDFAFSVRRP